MKVIKRTLTFNIHKRKGQENNAPIRLRVSFLGNRIDLLTGYSIAVDDWEDTKVKVGAINKRGVSADVINDSINDIKSAVENVFKLAELQDRVPDKEELKLAVAEIKNKNKQVVVKPKKEENEEKEDEKDVSFFDTFDEFMRTNGKLNNWTTSTFTKFKTVKKHLQDFNKKLTFEFFNQEGLSDYVIFLQTKKNMRNSTIKKQLGFLTWYLRWAYNGNYTKVDDFKAFKPKIKNVQKKVIFLTEEEKKKINEYEIPQEKQYLERVRDVLMFSCYTGLRYSDVFNLKRSDVKANQIEITTVKTSDSLIIELNKHSKAILDKYKEIPFENDKVLPVISNQKMNDYLKELGQLAGLNEQVRITHYEGNKRIDNLYPKYQLLSTHIGRRTFIITALSIGIPVQVVMKWTGHSDYKSMKPYIDIADKTKKNEMSKFDML
ncbi:MAG: phage integrase SAM-like domain-containing protein [Tenacibaculum sp.]|nr:phage integrase SAM-like domain-containing protein [Tenacibaculum sp.]